MVEFGLSITFITEFVLVLNIFDSIPPAITVTPAAPASVTLKAELLTALPGTVAKPSTLK